MKKLRFNHVSLEQLPDIAKKILQFVKQSTGSTATEIQPGACVLAVYGQMGAGKTTLIKEICRQLGSRDSFSSPTYNIVNEYLTGNDGKIYHVDLYRLTNIEEALAIGIEEYINGENYCFIEWPELIEQLLPPDVVKIQIKFDNNTREIFIFMIQIVTTDGRKEKRI